MLVVVVGRIPYLLMSFCIYLKFHQDIPTDVIITTKATNLTLYLYRSRCVKTIHDIDQRLGMAYTPWQSRTQFYLSACNCHMRGKSFSSSSSCLGVIVVNHDFITGLYYCGPPHSWKLQI